MAKAKKTFRKFTRINGKRSSACFSTKEDADRWAEQKKREKRLFRAGIVDVLNPLELHEFIGKWLLKRLSNGKPKGSWVVDEARVRNYILPKFGNRKLHQIDTPEWEDFLDALILEDELSPATRNRVRSLLSKLYNDARRARVVLKNPIQDIPKLGETDDLWDYWHTTDEVQSYLRQSLEESPSFFLLAHLGLNAGTRVGETLGLFREDISRNPGRINVSKIYEQATDKVHVRTKGGRRRWLGISDEMAKVFDRFDEMTKHRPKHWPLICHDDGRHMDQHQIRAIHARSCNRAGVKEIRVHDLRHTYASHFVMNGGSLAELQALLGHSSSQMTQRYAHLAPGFLESKANRVAFSGIDDDLIGGNNLIVLPKAD